MIDPNCIRCPLSTTRTRVVSLSPGGEKRLLIIGRDPGKVEDREGIPFHPDAPAGGLLRRSLKTFDLLDISNFDNSVRCHTPKDRGPRADEVAACNIWLAGSIRESKPEMILCLGQEAVEAVLNPREYRPKKSAWPIKEVHGTKVGEYRGVQVWSAYHPSGALRNGKLRREFMGDLRKVAKELGVGARMPAQDWRVWDGGYIPDIPPDAPVVVDVETSMETGELLGYSLAWRSGEIRTMYVPWNELGFYLLQGIASRHRMIAHNAKFDWVALKDDGIFIDAARMDDTMLMAYVLRRNQFVGSLGLKELAAYEFGVSWPTIEELGNPEEMTLEVIAEYACQDAAAELMLWEKYREEMGRGEVHSI